MEVQFFGANCISLSNKGVRLVIDDNLADIGGKTVTKSGDTVLYTGPHSDPKTDVHIVLDHPGEYEVNEISIYGIPVRAHMDEPDKKDATAYKIIFDDIRVLVLGHVYPELSEQELERFGMVDVLFVPVGGNGYTTDPVGALKLIKKIEPKIVIPTHYHDSTLNFPVPQQSLEQALSALSMEPKQTTDKLKLKSSDIVEGTQLVLLTKP